MKKANLFILLFLALAVALSSCSRLSPGNSETGGDGGTTLNEGSSDETTEYLGVVNRNKTICIDPGHGFGDVGAESEYVGEFTEKDINLKFANFLYDELSTRGYQVFMTHDGQNFPLTEVDDGNNNYDFKERIQYANSEGMDYFISIHCNTYSGYQDVQGARIYYSEDSRIPVKDVARAAEFLCDRLHKAFPDYREPLSYETPADNSFYVTHWAESCALLLEIGYMTNREDAENMLDDDWHLKMVSAVADGIDDYFRE